MKNQDNLDQKKRLAFAERFNKALDLRSYPPLHKGRINYIQEIFSLSRAGANKWMHGKAIPHHNTCIKIAEKLGVNLQWLETGEGELQKIDAAQFQPSTYVIEIPVITMLQACRFKEVLKESSKAKEKIIVSNDLSKDTFAVKLTGNSMSPRFSAGSILLIDPSTIIADGDYVLARTTFMPESILRQYVVGSAGNYLIASNPKFEPILLQKKDNLIGKVVEVKTALL